MHRELQITDQTILEHEKIYVNFMRELENNLRNDNKNKVGIDDLYIAIRTLKEDINQNLDATVKSIIEKLNNKEVDKEIDTEKSN